jgi:hypothetical protein
MQCEDLDRFIFPQGSMLLGQVRFCAQNQIWGITISSHSTEHRLRMGAGENICTDKE